METGCVNVNWTEMVKNHVQMLALNPLSWSFKSWQLPAHLMVGGGNACASHNNVMSFL
jgi:hypothetical protein